MLSCVTVPDSLRLLLDAAHGAFTAPSFATFRDLVTGMLGALGEHSVTGMWIAAGLAGRAHWSRAHRFFSRARWDPDTLGLLLARLVVTLFAPEGALTVLVDDTLFHRCGKKVHGAFFQHDGSARGRDGLGRGNCFVILARAVSVPFMTRTVALPLLFRLNLGKGADSKPDQARAMVGLIARAFPERALHVVADALYRGASWRTLPGNTTFTTRLASNAALNRRPESPTVRKRGHPVWKGPKLPSLAQLAAGAAWHGVEAGLYGKSVTVQIAVLDCLWWGSLHRTPVRLVLAREPGSTKTYDIALITTDLAATATAILERYSRRWSIEQTIRDCKNLLGVGQARNRLRLAVERTVPFQILCLTILFCWYEQARSAAVPHLADAIRTRPWDRHKTHVSVDDMLITFRRHRITWNTAGHDASRQIPATQVTPGLAAA